MRALGKPVECRYCYSTFPSFDGACDAGEASDRIDEWAREQTLAEDIQPVEEDSIHRPK